MSPGNSEGRPGEKAATTRTLDPVASVQPIAEIRCACGIELCDRPDPSACAVHGELHRMVCLGGAHG